MNPEDVTIETVASVPVGTLPTKLGDFMDLLDKCLDKIPMDHVETARVYFDVVQLDNRAVSSNFVMTYERPLTAAEKEELALTRAKALLDFEEKERAELTRLTTKYGVPK